MEEEEGEFGFIEPHLADQEQSSIRTIRDSRQTACSWEWWAVRRISLHQCQVSKRYCDYNVALHEPIYQQIHTATYHIAIITLTSQSHSKEPLVFSEVAWEADWKYLLFGNLRVLGDTEIDHHQHQVTWHILSTPHRFRMSQLAYLDAI